MNLRLALPLTLGLLSSEAALSRAAAACPACAATKAEPNGAAPKQVWWVTGAFLLVPSGVVLAGALALRQKRER